MTCTLCGGSIVDVPAAVSPDGTVKLCGGCVTSRSEVAGLLANVVATFSEPAPPPPPAFGVGDE